MKRLLSASLLFSSTALLMSWPTQAQELSPECSSLLGVVSQTAGNLSAALNEGTAEELPFGRIADVAATAATEFEAIAITDEALQGYRDRYVSLYSNISTASRELSAAAETGDDSVVLPAYQAFLAAVQPEEILMHETKVYCSY